MCVESPTTTRRFFAVGIRLSASISRSQSVEVVALGDDDERGRVQQPRQEGIDAVGHQRLPDSMVLRFWYAGA